MEMWLSRGQWRRRMELIHFFIFYQLYLNSGHYIIHACPLISFGCYVATTPLNSLPYSAWVPIFHHSSAKVKFHLCCSCSSQNVEEEDVKGIAPDTFHMGHIKLRKASLLIITLILIWWAPSKHHAQVQESNLMKSVILPVFILFWT